jgi:hypothetical protein
VPGPLRSPLRRRRLLLAFVAAVTAAGAALTAAPAAADPGPDGSPTSLQSQLADASRAYNDAKGKLDAAKQRQGELTAQAQATADQLTALTPEVNALATASYKSGRLSGVDILLDSGSADDFLSRATALQLRLIHDNHTLRTIADTQDRLVGQLAAIAAEVQTQQTQLATMDKRKSDLEKALAAAGSRPSGGVGPIGAGSATPAPRNPDGTWPKEVCSVPDPTTSGCLTPRTLHSLQEARKAGFTHYVACFRNEASGEHPLGRACDYAANAAGFQNVAATGADKAYGDRLAAWFLANADRLAVLYVIWYRQIWLPATGWKTYHGDGSPAGDHVNHVHVSTQ